MADFLSVIPGLIETHLVPAAVIAAIGSLVSALLMSVSRGKAVFRVMGILFYTALLAAVFCILYTRIRFACLGY